MVDVRDDGDHLHRVQLPAPQQGLVDASDAFALCVTCWSAWNSTRFILRSAITPRPVLTSTPQTALGHVRPVGDRNERDGHVVALEFAFQHLPQGEGRVEHSACLQSRQNQLVPADRPMRYACSRFGSSFSPPRPGHSPCNSARPSQTPRRISNAPLAVWLTPAFFRKSDCSSLSAFCSKSPAPGRSVSLTSAAGSVTSCVTFASFGSGMTGRTHCSSGCALATTGAVAITFAVNTITLATIRKRGRSPSRHIFA